MHRHLSLQLVISLLLAGLVTSACGAFTPAPTPTPIPPTATAAPTLTLVPPTAIPAATPVPVGVIYFFFSTMCPWCDNQAAIIERFHQGNPNVKVVGVPIYATQQEAKDWASRQGLTFEVRKDDDLLNMIGGVSRHPVVAFQSALGGLLVRASDGVIQEQALNESFQSFVTGGEVAIRHGGG